MESLMGLAEFLTVFAVSGGVTFIALQAHKHLLSDFMDKIHFQFDGQRRRCDQVKKRVQFAGDVVEPSSDNKDYQRKNGIARMSHQEEDQMPRNRQVLYSGIIKYRMMLRTQQV